VEQIDRGGPVTVTDEKMTRFLLTLDAAVDTVFAAARTGLAGETYIPMLPSAYVMDIARALIGERKISIEVVGVRPGEKVDEVMVSEEEVARTTERDGYYVIRPLLPELAGERSPRPARTTEYSSREASLDIAAIHELLRPSLGGPPD
jgi:UDP-glucose 4-epimerase